MKKNIIKKFADFKRRNSLSNDIIKQMITEYANSELDLARTYFSNKYNISKSIFYKARDYAVICCLVDEDTCKRIKKKTVENYKRHNPKNTSNGALAHFSDLRVKRQEFLNTFSDNEIRDIAFKYAEGISVKNIAFGYDIGEFGIKLLLKKGIVLLVVDKETTDSIKNRVGSKLDKILHSRENNKQIILDCIEKEIICLNLKIEHYELYFRDLKEKPSKEILQQKLSDVIKKKKQVLRY